MWIRFIVAAVFVSLSVGNPARAENWPRFRGPTGQGISSETNLPDQWSSEDNVRWKAEIPGEGWSSPIVWKDHVVVTSTTDGGVTCRVIAVDRISGKLRWNKEVFQQSPKRKEQKNSYATPTPTTDGERVYAVFGDGSLVALDFEGNIEWTNRDFKFYSQHGLGASPILHGDLLIMPLDGSNEGDDKTIGWKSPWDKAVLLALDKKTGKVAWQGKRGLSRIAHVTPNLLLAGDDAQLISGAGDVIQGFNPKSGERLWTVYSQGEGVVPSIVIGDGLVYSVSGFEKPTIRAVRTDGTGDVTKTHIAWEQTKGVPSMSSLLYVKPHLYAVTDGGAMSCYDAGTGDVVWQNRVSGKHSASPMYGDGKIYFLSEDGESVIIKPGAKFEIIARNSVGEPCQASYAVSQGNIFIRSQHHLFCIGK
jgi:outer membrane protein assembly factor BamB